MPGFWKIPQFITVIFLLFLFINVGASISNVPSHIAVRENTVDFSFEVTNDTDFRAPLEVELFVPTEYEVVELPGWVDAGESATVKIRLFPNKDLTGSRYDSLLVVRLGSEEFEKKIRINFSESLPVEDDEEEENSEEEGQFVGIVGLVSLFSQEGLLPGDVLEFLVDIVLIFIAAFLLIAFISRLVKRLNSPQQYAEEKKYSWETGAKGNRQTRLEEIKEVKVNKLEPYNPALEDLKNKINNKVGEGGFR